MVNRDVVEAIIVNKKNEVLLQKKTLDYKTISGGGWSLFGGEIEKGEDLEQALKREVKEEINYEIDKFKLFKIEDYKLQNGMQGKRYIFIVFFDGNISLISLSEGGGFGFFSSSELNSIKIIDACLKSLKDYFKIK